MKRLFLLLTTLVATLSMSAQREVYILSMSAQREVYISTSFHEPATDGLRFIYSYDGWQWDSIPGTWLKPEVGKQKVMRDPSIIRTPDGVFHLVWTSSWCGDLGFGYACSKDLKNWSEQPRIRLCLFKRFEELERAAFHQGDDRHNYGECVGARTILGR